MTDPLSNTPLGHLLGQAGMDAVLDHQPDDFPSALAAVIRDHFRGQTVTGDAITAKALALGLKPTHPNAWGAAYGAIAKRYPGLLRATGQWVKSSINPRNHGSRYPLYEVAP
jgi:hypothetical protein